MLLHQKKSVRSKSKRKRVRAVFAALLVLLVCAACVWAGAKLLGGPAVGKVSGELEQACVLKVVDGDTLKVSLTDGTENYVRLIGIDTPESVAADDSRNSEEGVVAAGYTKSLVAVGQTVWLQKDTSDTDRYGRWLRYVWLERPQRPSNANEAAEKMLNAILVREGYAQAKRYKPDIAYAEAFETWGEEALSRGKGVSYLWE